MQIVAMEFGTPLGSFTSIHSNMASFPIPNDSPYHQLMAMGGWPPQAARPVHLYHGGHHLQPYPVNGVGFRDVPPPVIVFPGRHPQRMVDPRRPRTILRNIITRLHVRFVAPPHGIFFLGRPRHQQVRFRDHMLGHAGFEPPPQVVSFIRRHHRNYSLNGFPRRSHNLGVRTHNMRRRHGAFGATSRGSFFRVRDTSIERGDMTDEVSVSPSPSPSPSPPPPPPPSPGCYVKEKLERLRVNGKEAEFAHDDQCSICLEAFDDGDEEVKSEESLDLVRTPCGHVFHHQCIASWLENSPDCPLCRHNVLD